SQPCGWERQWTRARLYTSCSRWPIENPRGLRMQVAKQILTSSLLLALSAFAQQAHNSAPLASTTPASAQQVTPTPPRPIQGTPSTLDQVVDRVVEREHGLMEAMKTRTPIVE